jgi:hypothetical protein
MSTDVSEVSAASIIALMMEAARTSETSVDIQLRTQQYIPEDSELYKIQLFSFTVLLNIIISGKKKLFFCGLLRKSCFKTLFFFTISYLDMY